MDVLVIGGTVFLGRAVVAAALAQGHAVTVFNRGRSGPRPARVAEVRGDRSAPADLAQLAGRHFDVVIDTCGYVPVDVAASAKLLVETCGRYVFVSSINVYPGWPADTDYHAGGVHEGEPDATRADVPADLAEPGPYGWLKVGCERAVLRAFGVERCTILRAGAIVGPHDSAIGRLPWWLHRVARGGEVLVPGSPSDPVALVDARDIAQFALTGVAGTFEVGGPTARDTRAELLTACIAATGANPTLTYVDGEWLADQGVAAWTEIPLWVPTSEGPGVFAHDNAAAAAAGMRWRPLAETVADVWAWQSAIPGGWQRTEHTPGLAPTREQELLAAWRAR